MCDIDRRNFIKLSSAGAMTLSLGRVAAAGDVAGLDAGRPVFFHGDGLNLNPREYAAVLAGITSYYGRRSLQQDVGRGGLAVAGSEGRMIMQ